MAIPKYSELFNPLLGALRRLGGSASIIELDEEVIKSLGLTDEEIATPHGQRDTEIEYRLAWARTYLKGYGVITNSARGVWALTSEGHTVESVDPNTVVQAVRAKSRVGRKPKPGDASDPSLENSPDASGIDAVADAEAVLERNWRDELQSTLLGLSPAAFERLCQRLLRESGFVEVRVTGRSGDGGIDGVGVVRLGGLLGFPILFQCKRYQGSVSSSTVRDFRGAMIGRADRGLIITTGTFSREAKAEAIRDGAPPIDLLDGEQLLDKLKELRLGVGVELIEKVSVVPDWFKQFE
jgi:restriction system protein